MAKLNLNAVQQSVVLAAMGNADSITITAGKTTDGLTKLPLPGNVSIEVSGLNIGKGLVMEVKKDFSYEVKAVEKRKSTKSSSGPMNTMKMSSNAMMI